MASGSPSATMQSLVKQLLSAIVIMMIMTKPYQTTLTLTKLSHCRYQLTPKCQPGRADCQLLMPRPKRTAVVVMLVLVVVVRLHRRKSTLASMAHSLQPGNHKQRTYCVPKQPMEEYIIGNDGNAWEKESNILSEASPPVVRHSKLQ